MSAWVIGFVCLFFFSLHIQRIILLSLRSNNPTKIHLELFLFQTF